ncbi:MAG TPA: hypothetical protein VIC33_04810 [Vicinamibacterales bacterium]|jgi:hypothetical protein
MLTAISRTRLAALCFAVPAILVALVIGAGVHIAFGVGALLVALCLVPAAVVLLVWRGAPPLTVGELLYAVEEQKDGRG